MMLYHRQQLRQVGCLYHSLYAVTGDEGVLEHVEDTSDARFAARLAGLGLLAFPFWITPAGSAPADFLFWQVLRARLTEDNSTNQGHVPLLIAVRGTSPPWLHSVAVTLPISSSEDTVQISDSNFSEPFTLTWAAFLLSDYARAHRVEMLGPVDLEAYPDGGTQAGLR